jgi:hypothetical protein
MTTSRFSNYSLAWRICRYLLRQLALGTFRFSRWLMVRGFQFIFGLLALIASPDSSGRAPDEFKDLVQSDSPENLANRTPQSDGFWRLYLQAYSPRQWRMRRLLTMTAGRDLKHEEPREGR